MRWQGTCYRAHDPRWAWTPTSGEGAAAKGGRFNPVGVPALYLALSIEGMLLEMGHGFAHRFDPLTVCSSSVDVDDLADLRTVRGRAAEGVKLADMECAWSHELALGKVPPSWRISTALIERGAAGILVPSFATGARSDIGNLVLWRWGASLPHKVEVHDPEGRLPRDQASWADPSQKGS
ncbi:MAG: RES family NAD+ phosphorylase [Parvibaculaceae bacterium]